MKQLLFKIFKCFFYCYNFLGVICFLRKGLMFKNFFLIASLFFFLILPYFSLAKSEEMNFLADSVVVGVDGIIKASGNVKVQNGNIFIRAESIEIDPNTRKIEFGKIYEFNDGRNTTFESGAAIIDQNLSNGVISAAKILVDETIKINADKLILGKGGIQSAENIQQVTSCKQCEEKEPNWYFKAASAQRDLQNLNIIYRDVVLRVKGIPIAYLPYLRLPDPSVDRARGFLVPEAVLTSNLGAGLKLPYFVPIGNSRDILISPFLTPKTNTLEFRYREKFRSGDLILKGAVSNDQIFGERLRYFYKADGEFQLSYGVNLGFNFGRVSDNSYLGDYSYSADNEIESKISLDKVLVAPSRFFEGGLTYYRDTDDRNALSEYYSFDGSFVKNIQQKFLPGNLYFDTRINSSLNVNTENGFSRPPSLAQFGLNYSNDDQTYSMIIQNRSFLQFNSFVNAKDDNSTSEDFTLKYGISSKFKLPLIKRKAYNSNTLTPWVMVALNGQEGLASGDFFVGNEELSFGNLSQVNKYSSLSESEKGFSLSLGIDSEIFLENGQRLVLSFATHQSAGSTLNPIYNTGLGAEKLSYIGRFDLRSKNRNLLNGSVLVSNDGTLLNGNLLGKASSSKFDLKGRYEYYSPKTDARLSKAIENFEFGSSYNFWKNLNLNTSGRFDLIQDNLATTSIDLEAPYGSWRYKISKKYLKTDAERLSLSAIYEDECTVLKLAFEKRYLDLGSSDPVQVITVLAQFKPFAGFVLSKGLDDENLVNSMF